eukprot:Seg3162.1 transcript_id=Seg3162.1/GoldUCD/mRNA.D3Y31 product="hypothetical protein" protein_id=Seg3162.1/GoldUCD/D3Y31
MEGAGSSDSVESVESSSSSDEEEVDGPLEKAARAGADLRVPQKAAIARMRKIQSNPANLQRGKRGANDPKVSGHKNEYLTVVNGKLRCNACKEPISKKSSSVKKHIASKKHEMAKKAAVKEKSKDQSIIQMFRATDQRLNTKGETLPNEMRLFRYDLVESFLQAGIPISKINSLRPFLQKYGHRLTARGHLSEIIPQVMEREKETLKNEIAPHDGFSVVFDGSSRLGEALAIVIRFIDKNWNIQERLVRLETLAKSLKHQELAQRLIQCLAVDYSIQPNFILAAMRDGAAVNEAAINQIKFYFPSIFNVTCFSHVVDTSGKRFQFRLLDTFFKYWNAMFAHSPAVRLAWKTRTGKAMRTHSVTRWWSKWEVLDQVCQYFGDIEPFLAEIEGLVPATRDHLLELFNDQENVSDLKLELAAFIDGGKSFVTTTYYLEGEGPLVLTCYQQLTALAQAVGIGSYPNSHAVALERANGDQVLFNQFMAQAKSCIRPGFLYYLEKFNVEFHDVVRAFRGARLCCPVQVQSLNPTADSLQLLRNFPFLDDDTIIAGLVEELPMYLALVDGTQIQVEDEKLKWWERNASNLPRWAKAVKKILVVQPSSAAAERVFSCMKSSLSYEQQSALEETVEASVMLRYNNNKRAKHGQ